MIVVFGSINIDLVFRLPTLPAAGETVLGDSYSVVAGGKGANQAVAAARDGARVALVGAVGDDGFTAPALAELGAAGVDLTRVARVAAPTGCAAIAVDAKGANLILVASGANLHARAAMVPDEWLDRGTTLVVQREVPMAELAALLPRARARGCRVVLNTAPAGPIPAAALAAVDVLVANEGEAAALAAERGLAGGGAAALAQALGCVVVVTRGGDGVEAAGGGTVLRGRALKITPVDTTGAGDCFVGVLAAALDRGAALGPALHRAAVAAGLACTRLGAQPGMPTRSETDARLGDLAAPC
ncbi:MAG: ribokinase [Alphaproteobacteria bacterium]|nr:ribokinase [Alphaproteobacteria bacterium]